MYPRNSAEYVLYGAGAEWNDVDCESGSFESRP